MKTVLWLSFALAVGLYIVSPVSDPDLWWHIAAGKWIVSHGAIPTVDQWSMFGVGKPWRAYSWSNEIVFALIDSHFGVQGLLAASCVLGVAVSLVLFWSFGKVAKNHFLGAMLGALVVATSYNHFSLRPQILIWILFAYLLTLANDVEQGKAERQTLVKIFLTMALWANSHLSAVLGLLGLATFSYSAAGKLRTRNAVLAGFLGTLATPYLGGEWITFVTKASHPFQHANVAEFQPMNIMQYSTAFFVLLISVAMLGLHYLPDRKLLVKALGLCAFSLGGLAVGKFLPMAAIYAGAFIAFQFAYASEQGKELGNLNEALRRLEAAVSKISVSGLSWVLLCFCFLFVMKLKARPLEDALVPVRQVDIILDNKLPKPILNSFTHGGYLMYRFTDDKGEIAPDSLVVVDGRTNVTPPEVFKKLDAALVGAENWQEIFELVQPATVLWPKESPLYAILKERSEWCVIDDDGKAKHGLVLLTKRDAQQRCPTIEKKTYKSVNED